MKNFALLPHPNASESVWGTPLLFFIITFPIETALVHPLVLLIIECFVFMDSAASHWLRALFRESPDRLQSLFTRLSYLPLRMNAALMLEARSSPRLVSFSPPLFRFQPPIKRFISRNIGGACPMTLSRILTFFLVT